MGRSGGGWEGCRREVSGGGRNLTVVFRADEVGKGEGSPSSSSFCALAVQGILWWLLLVHVDSCCYFLLGVLSVCG